jgi:hypothetical protein
MAKNTFRSKSFAGNTFASGTFNGIGVTPVVITSFGGTWTEAARGRVAREKPRGRQLTEPARGRQFTEPDRG